MKYNIKMGLLTSLLYWQVLFYENYIYFMREWEIISWNIKKSWFAFHSSLSPLSLDVVLALFVLPKIGSVFPTAKSTLSTSGSTSRRQAGRPGRVRAPKPDRCLRSASYLPRVSKAPVHPSTSIASSKHIPRYPKSDIRFPKVASSPHRARELGCNFRLRSYRKEIINIA